MLLLIFLLGSYLTIQVNGLESAEEWVNLCCENKIEFKKLWDKLDSLAKERATDRARIEELYMLSSQLLNKLNGPTKKDPLEEDEIIQVLSKRSKNEGLALPKFHHRHVGLTQPDIVIVKSLEENQPAELIAYVEENERRIDIVLNRTDRLETELRRIFSNVQTRLETLEKTVKFWQNVHQNNAEQLEDFNHDAEESGDMFSSGSGDGRFEERFPPSHPSTNNSLLTEAKARYDLLLAKQDALENRIDDLHFKLHTSTSKLAKIEKYIDYKVQYVEHRLAESVSEVQRVIYNNLWPALNRTNNLTLAVKRVQMDHYKAVQECQTTRNQVESDLLRYGEKLNYLHLKLLNGSFMSLKTDYTDVRRDLETARIKEDLGSLEKQLINNEKLIKDAYVKMKFKADYSQLKEFALDLKKCMEKLEDVTKFNASLATVGEQILRLERQLPIDCMQETPARYGTYNSGVYLIKPKQVLSTVPVFCDMTENGGGWTLIQQRLSADVSFHHNWTEYKQGFGNISENFWLGNDIIHALTTQRPYRLRIETVDIFDDVYTADYDLFKISNESQGYALALGSYVEGNLTDSFREHNGMRFSTPDVDNDGSSTHCAKFYESGWWFTHCQTVNLNGNFHIGMIWFSKITQDWLQMKKTRMKIKPYYQ